MTPDNKLQERIAAWRSADNKSFESEEIAARYERRIQRFLDVVSLRLPDRVPNLLLAMDYMITYGGATRADTFYDGEKTSRAIFKFMEDFQPEYMFIGSGVPIGKVLDLFDYKAYRWPGGNLPPDIPFQYVEGEYMYADEYDQFINNPEGFLIRTYFPRIFGNLPGLDLFPNLFHAVELYGIGGILAAFSRPPLRETLEKILQAADLMSKGLEFSRSVTAEIIRKWGIPSIPGGVTFAPFDIISDTLRGTQGALMDMYRCPDKLLAACEVVTPISIDMAESMHAPGMSPFIFIPLHKGADSFMSNDQFARFYWPGLKAQLLGIIDAGLIPVPFVEGSYNNRLDIIADSGLPAGKTVWLFDQTDLKAAKKKIGEWACIGGNVPSSLFRTGTAQEMEACCRDLINTAGAGGGYFLAPGVGVDKSLPEVVHAFINSTKKYGVY